MKNLLIFLIIGSIIALAGVYFELWTIPKLEKFPTIGRQAEDVKSSRERSAQERINKDMDDAPPSGPFGVDRSKSERVKQLEDSRKQLEK